MLCSYLLLENFTFTLSLFSNRDRSMMWIMRDLTLITWQAEGLQPHQKWSQHPTAPYLNMKKPLIFVLSNQNIPGLPFCNFLCIFPGAHWLESFFHFTSYFYNSVLTIPIKVSIPKYFFP